MKVLISDSLSEEGVSKLQEHFDVDVSTGLSEDELVEKIVDFDALVIRSGTQVTKRVIEAADNLKIVGRAGVGVDNVDIDLHLWPIPEDESEEGLLVKVILKPESDCSTVPDFLRTDHRSGITEGALAELFGMEAMPWYNEVNETKHRMAFDMYCNNAKWKKVSGKTKRPMRVRPREFI